MASLAQMERELIAERTKAGLEAARQLGRKGGQKAQNEREQAGIRQKTPCKRHTAQRSCQKS